MYFWNSRSVSSWRDIRLAERLKILREYDGLLKRSQRSAPAELWNSEISDSKNEAEALENATKGKTLEVLNILRKAVQFRATIWKKFRPHTRILEYSLTWHLVTLHLKVPIKVPYLLKLS